MGCPAEVMPRTGPMIYESFFKYFAAPRKEEPRSSTLM
jgi:hypothetical protein